MSSWLFFGEDRVNKKDIRLLMLYVNIRVIGFVTYLLKKF